jgi:arginase
MAGAARLPLTYPEAAVVEEDTLADQTLAVAAHLPARPLVLGGCCCAHLGAAEALAARHGRIAILWLDAHGDLNTIQSSPSGNPWATPLRRLIDGGVVDAEDVALVGARNLDPPEEAFIAEQGVHVGPKALERALDGVAGVYVALDCDVLDPGEGVDVWLPEPDGLSLADVEAVLGQAIERAPLAGAGLTGLVPSERNERHLTRLCRALGI